MNDQFTPFYHKNKNEYCFNLKDSSTMVRQKNKMKTGNSKQRLNIKIVNYMMLLMLLKKVWLCMQQTGYFGIPYQMLLDKISGRTSIKIQHCRYQSVLGEHIENKSVEWLLTSARMGFAMSVVF